MITRILKILIVLSFLALVSYYVTIYQNQNIGFSPAVISNSTSTVYLEKPTKMFFVGDIMLDRGVEVLMKKNGWQYPFEKISTILSEFDFGIANLEGPVLENPPYNGATSMQFAFDRQALEGLKKLKIDYVSLANNHTDNMGKAGFKETQKVLNDAQIKHFGDPWYCFGSIEDDERKIILMGINLVYDRLCNIKEIEQEVVKLRQENQDYYFIVFPHWGQEYESQSNQAQKKLAHSLIENGVDLIVGHHPHVNQEIELYNGKMIVYSIGNFVFDQYFSKETQESFILGLDLYIDKQVFKILPIELYQSQPVLQSKENGELFWQKMQELFNTTTKSIVNGFEFNLPRMIVEPVE